MSDALTDIYRDQRRAEVTEKIRELENEELTVERAKKLIKLWQEHKNIRGGYWTSSDRKLADKKVEELNKFIAKAEEGDKMNKNKLINEIMTSMHNIDFLANDIQVELCMIHERLKLICEHKFNENDRCVLCGYVKGEEINEKEE